MRRKKEKLEKETRLLGNSLAHLDLVALEKNRENCSWPSTYYGKVQALLGILEPQIVVEIGVAYGYHAQHILRENPGVAYIGIDPYLSGYDSADLFDRDVAELFGTNPSAGMERLFRAVSEGLTKEFGPRAEIRRMRSTVAAQDFQDKSVDFVFVDGDHRFEAVERDLMDWWPKIRSGGLLVGDDFGWDGVQKAARRFFQSEGVAFFLLEGPDSTHQSFFAVKP